MSQTRNYLENIHFVYHAASNINLCNKQAKLKLQKLTVEKNGPVIHFDLPISTNAEIRLYCELAAAASDYLLHISIPFTGKILTGPEGVLGGKTALLHMMLLVGANFLNHLLEENKVETIDDFKRRLRYEYDNVLLNAECPGKDYHIHRYSAMLIKTPYLPSNEKKSAPNILYEQSYFFTPVRPLPQDGLFTPLNPPIPIKSVVDVIFHNYTLHYFTTEEGQRHCQSMLELLAEKIENSERMQEIHSVLAMKHSQPLLPLIKAKCLTRALLASQQDMLSEDEKTFFDFLMSFMRDDTPNLKPTPAAARASIPVSLPEAMEAMNAYFIGKYTELKDINQQTKPSMTPC